MSSKPLKPASIDLTKIAHDKLKVKKYKNGQESKQVRMTYDKTEFRIQTPIAKVPFGLTVGEELDNEGKPIKDSKKPKKYSLDFNIGGTPQLEEFKEIMKKLDHKNIEHIVSQSQEWWGKKFTTEMITELCYGSLIKADKKGDYPDRFKVKLPFFEGVPRFKVYDEHNKIVEWCKIEEGKAPVIDWSWAKNHMQIEAIIECEGLWEVNKKVYCTFKALQIRVRQPEELPECAFDDIPAVVDELNNLNVDSNSIKVVDEDVDDEEVDEEVDEEGDEEEE